MITANFQFSTLNIGLLFSHISVEIKQVTVFLRQVNVTFFPFAGSFSYILQHSQPNRFPDCEPTLLKLNILPLFVAAAKGAIKQELFSRINTIFLPDMERNATF